MFGLTPLFLLCMLLTLHQMDDHKEEPSEEESEEEDPVVQREMTWPYSFVNKRISIPRELGKRAAANQ